MVQCSCANQVRADGKPASDPTRTTALRKQYQAALSKRFRWLKGEILANINRLLGADSNFTIRAQEERGLRALRRLKKQGLSAAEISFEIFENVNGRLAQIANAFEFTTDPAKVDAFMDWLREQVDLGILEVTERIGPNVAAHSAWQNTFVQSAYQKGLASSYPKMRRAAFPAAVVDSLEGAGQSLLGGVVGFNVPIHADAVGTLFIRNFNELQGITEAMSQQISRTLAQGVAEGKGTKTIARELNKVVDNIGRVRSRVLARTEVIRAHSEANLNSFESAKALGVNVLVSLITAGDDRVDFDGAAGPCIDIENETASEPIPIKEARGVIPVHPNCRCAWIPVDGDALQKAA